MNLHNLLRSSHLGLFYMHAASTGNTKNSSKNQCIDSVCKPLEGLWESSVVFRLLYLSLLTWLRSWKLCGRGEGYTESESMMVSGCQKNCVKKDSGDFLGGPVVKILHFHCRDCRFDSWLGN